MESEIIFMKVMVFYIEIQCLNNCSEVKGREKGISSEDSRKPLIDISVNIYIVVLKEHFVLLSFHPLFI